MKEITRIVTAELTFIEEFDENEGDELLTDIREIEKRIKLAFDMLDDANVLKVQDFEIDKDCNTL